MRTETKSIEHKTLYQLFGKRIIDIAFSFFALMIILPLFYIIIILIILDSKGSPFFIQKRYGKRGIPFRLIKFRSMVVSSNDSCVQFEPGNNKRITRIGFLLRKTKIDELPELINVFKGDMSIVGPRPEVEKYILLYREEFQNVLKVRPGLSDIASLKYIDEEEILKNEFDAEKYYIKVILPDKLQLAQYYIKNVSFKTDICIINDTIKGIVKRLVC